MIDRLPFYTRREALQKKIMQITKNDTVERQNAYVQDLKNNGFDFGLVVAEAFVRGMRDIGYKSSATAIDELIDNSIEAGANDVHVIFGYGAHSDAKPQSIAVVDDGHGMEGDMVRAAVLWGGGHRTNSRELFGRYGFGLPSSCVSQGQRFEVYSKTADGVWKMVYIDLEEIKEGTFYSENGRPAAPAPVDQKPPAWLLTEIREAYGRDLQHGTVVLVSKLDNLTWKTTKLLTREMTQHFGLVYRKWLRSVNVHVDGKKVRPVDPLFLDETAQFFDENELRAEPQPDIDLIVKDRDSGEALGSVKVRASYMPPGFQNTDGRVGGPTKGRFAVMKENNGLLVLRAGRQIDVVTTKCPWVTFQNYDRNWKIEIDYEPSIDEEFSITTSKQQIGLSERMWTLLEEAGVKRAIEALRKRYNDEAAVAKEKAEQPEDDDTRTSEEVMKASKKYKTTKTKPSGDQEDDREQNFRKKVKERAKRTGKSEEEAQHEIEGEIASNPYRLSFENVPGGNFYRVEGIASQVHVIINQAHPFFTDVHSGPDSTPRTRAALELMLFALAEAELDASTERQLFYESERPVWSQRISTALRLLEQKDPKEDIPATSAEAPEGDQASEAAA